MTAPEPSAPDLVPDPPPAPREPEILPEEDNGSLFLGGLLPLLGHVLAVIPPYLVGQLASGSGEGFQDLGAVVLTMLITEIVLALACLVTGVVLVVKGRRRFGYGLIVGWFIGALAAYTLLKVG